MVQRFALLIFLAVSLSSTARGQFDTIINVPSDEAPEDIGSNTQLNLFDSGSLPRSFDADDESGASSNIEVNISGGTVGSNFNANGGSTVNIDGGTVTAKALPQLA